MECFIVRTSHDTLLINSEVNCTKWIFMIFLILSFLFKHWKFHILFNSVLFTENIIVVWAISSICHRIFGIESISLFEVLHQRNETIHIRTIMVHVNNCNIFICYTNLYIICWQKLIIAHVIRFDTHKGSWVICFRVTVSIRTTDFNFLHVFLKFLTESSQVFIITLFFGFSLSTSVNKCTCIQFP